jgi:hypothetical protein
VQRLLTKKKVAKVLLLPFLGLLQHFFGVDFDTKPCSVRKVVGPRVIVTAIPATSKTVLIARGAHRRVPILGLADVNLNSVVQHALGGVDELLRPEEEAFLDVRRLIL